MSLFERFVDKVLIEKGSFTMKSERDEKRMYFFMQCDVGKARYVYGTDCWNDSKGTIDIHAKPDLVAIVSDNIVYIVDEIALMWHTECKGFLPDNVKLFYDYCDEQNKRLDMELFPELYDKVIPAEITNEEEMKECEQKARKALLSLEGRIQNPQAGIQFSPQDIADHLSGLCDLDDKIACWLNKVPKRFGDIDWAKVKGKHLLMKKYYEEKAGVEEYELDIAAGLRSVDANYVTVEFEFNGIVGCGKIAPRNIYSKMIYHEYFASFEFQPPKSGERLIQELGAARYAGDQDEDVLTCKHIRKITYGKKVLYRRKEITK